MLSKKWEHQVIMSWGINDERTRAWQAELDRYGAEGWELVSVIVRPEVPSYEEGTETNRVPRTVVFLKREKVDRQ